MDRPYEIVRRAGRDLVRIRARGSDLVSQPFVFRGTAFTAEQRAALGLTGLLPSAVSSLEGQVQRVYAQCARQRDDLGKHVYLTLLRDRNEVLFYRLISDNLDEMLPIVYTPTVGQAIERYSHEFRRARGVYLSINHMDQIEQSLRNFAATMDGVDLVVATDGEGILGIGDWGVGGIDISIGKIFVYVAAAGIHPRRTIPVVLDAGTDNPSLLGDPMYLGNRHPRVRGERYDEFVETYVTAAHRLFPDAVLHWEDLGQDNAHRVLQTYLDRVCTFNDDIQGTAAVALAAALAGVRAAGSRLRDQRIVIYGPGTAGVGIADVLRQALVRDGLTDAEAAARFWLVGRHGLLGAGVDAVIRDFQRRYLRPADPGPGEPRGGASLGETVAAIRPTMLIGTSTVRGAFTEPIVRTMASHVERPIILPLSNPTSKCEALPADLIAWTEGRALVATGSPFPPVERGGVRYEIAQANNALVFPGLGLGAIVAKASRITDHMLLAAATAVARVMERERRGAPLLPPVSDLRGVSARVAAAVALAAVDDGVARVPVEEEPVRQVHEAMWRPEYPEIEAI